MSKGFDEVFAERCDLYYAEVKKLGVPIEVWQEVLKEGLVPNDSSNEPRAFHWLNENRMLVSDLEPIDLTRPMGMDDRDYARWLLKQGQTRENDWRAWMDANMTPDASNSQEPSFEEEDDSAVLEEYFAERERRASLN